MTEVQKRPNLITGSTCKVKTGCGNLYVTLNFKDKAPFEVFVQLGKSGGCTSVDTEAVARLISLSLRSGVPVSEVIDQLRGLRCPSPIWGDGQVIYSCMDGISKGIEIIAKQEGIEIISKQEGIKTETPKDK